ncbi:MAG TPA: methyltransferase domain-containing protein [Acidimicrobiales bacterium]|nr:methyltransferase domain-containing protein [Acidimicrobiales bacterium]
MAALDPIEATVKQAARRARAAVRRLAAPLPRAGYQEQRVGAPLVERLSDDDLDRLNGLLPWVCFTVDGRGRRFGDAAWTGKREDPQPIPDRRVVLMDERLGLQGSHVLEIGCFEGVHTIALCQRAGRVTAVDARIDNVVKTIVRCAFHGWSPEVFTCDIEAPAAPAELAAVGADFVHHVGVLYHLRDPVSHVRALGAVAAKGLMLDTHVAPPDRATDELVVDGERFRYMRYAEGGRTEVFSGMYDHAKWLPLGTLTGLLTDAGFTTVDVVEERAERNGPRVLVLASR